MELEDELLKKWGINLQEAWMPAVFVQEQPPLYVSLATGALVPILRFQRRKHGGILAMRKLKDPLFGAWVILIPFSKFNECFPKQFGPFQKESSLPGIIFEGGYVSFQGSMSCRHLKFGFVATWRTPHVFFSLVGLIVTDRPVTKQRSIPDRSIQCFCSHIRT